MPLSLFLLSRSQCFLAAMPWHVLYQSGLADVVVQDEWLCKVTAVCGCCGKLWSAWFFCPSHARGGGSLSVLSSRALVDHVPSGCET
jgi:hypothetical protein